MKTLQNNFTTPEQSKRLFELGVPADSADCYLLRTHTKGDTFIVDVLHDELYSKKDKFTNMLEYLPCWSVGRIIEIMALCYKFDLPDSGSVQIYATDIKKRNVIDVLISDIERFINKIDFSKLEE